MRDDLIGKHVGGYEILGLIGHGGMATVYRAQQMSMNRVVAIKVLPRQFMNDDTYMQRFNREVKIVSKLEHRNIVPVYDYGEHEGQPYIVMRYMSGGSVDDLLAEGPLKLDKATNIIEQIAPALDYAHGKQVLHRDLKPSNVLMDDDGGAYLTDFGIARILGEQSNTNITTQGVVGTPSYMSPEQAQGQPLDGRSDVYSLGVMLFEMATGRRPFESDTPYSIAVMQVTTQPPAPRSYNPSIPAQVENVIYRVMEKQPAKRYPDAVSLSTALKQAVNGQLVSVDDTQPGFPRPQASAPRPQAPVPRAPAPYIAPFPPQPQPQSQVAPRVYPPQPQYTPPRGPSASSGQIAASFRRRRLPQRKNNFWMNVAIGGLIGCGLLTIIVIVIALLLGGFPGTAGAILGISTVPTVTTDFSDFQPNNSAILNRGDGAVGGDGGIRSTLDPTSEAARRRLLSSTQTVSEGAVAPAVDDLEILSTPQETARPITLQEAANQAGTAIASAPDAPAPTRILGVGEREPTLTPIPPIGPVQTSFSSGGLAFFDDRDGNYELYLLDLDTETPQRLTYDEADDTYPAVSPDGSQIAFQSDRDGDFDIYLMDINGENVRNLTHNSLFERIPAWTPDGQWIIFSSDTRDDGSYDLYQIRPDGTDLQPFLNNGERNSHPRWSPDGRYVVFTTGSSLDATGWEIGRLDTTTGEVIYLTDNTVKDWSPTFSPDGQTVLFLTDGDGNAAIAAMDIEGGNRRVLYDSPGYDWGASYSPDGESIFFTSDMTDGESELYVISTDGQVLQRLTIGGGMYGSWIPATS